MSEAGVPLITLPLASSRQAPGGAGWDLNVRSMNIPSGLLECLPKT